MNIPLVSMFRWFSQLLTSIDRGIPPTKDDRFYRYIPFISINWLMVSTPLKNMKVSWDDNSGYMEKMKFMFQTTNQITVALFVIKSPTEAPQRTAKARAEHGVGSPRTSAFF